MDVIIRGHNVDISDNLESFTHTKLDRLDRYLPNISEIRVDFSRQTTRRGGDVAIAQITLKHARGAILRAEERIRGEDKDALRAAINTAVDKMYRRIERFKGKKRSNRRPRDRFMITEEELSMAEELPEAVGVLEATEPDEVGEIDEEIVRRKLVPLSPMYEIEAMEQMELLDHSFFMFLNAETDTINVVYRRENGGYGVLVPEM
jgi:putative sigma-54 modulation protein